MAYELDQVNKTNLRVILQSADISGRDAHKVVAVMGILDKHKDKELVTIDDDLIEFIRATIDGVTIKGSFAGPLVRLQLALSQQVDEKDISNKRNASKKKSKSKPNKLASHGPPSPKNG